MARTKPTEREIMAALASIGGSLWRKHGKTRSYVNNLPTLYGLLVTRNDSGQLASATLDAEKIGTTQARKIIGRMADGKLWYDHDRGGWHTRDVNVDDAGWIIKEAQARLDAALLQDDAARKAATKAAAQPITAKQRRVLERARSDWFDIFDGFGGFGARGPSPAQIADMSREDASGYIDTIMADMGR